VAGLNKSTSRSGHKQMTFLLRSLAGCGGVIVFAQEPATLSNGDHLQVEGIFETATSPRWVHVPQRNAGDENHYSAAAVEKREGCNTTRVLQQWPE
jgi:hypothetical protein